MLVRSLVTMLLALTALATLGCRPPTAQFTAEPRSGPAPLEVQFTDRSDPGSRPITAWSWTFGDGESSTAENPAHTYDAEGTYDVALTVTTAQGTDEEMKAGYITVSGAEGEGEGEGEEGEGEGEEGEGEGEALMTLARSAPGGEVYTPGGTVDLELTLTYLDTEEIKALGVSETLPSGWTFVEVVGGEEPDSVVPRSNAGNTEFLWITVPEFPFSFTYRVQAPASASGAQEISGAALFRRMGPQLQSNREITVLNQN